MKSIPLKALGIGRHPSLPEGLSPADGSEAGLNADEAHDFMPAAICISVAENEAVLAGSGGAANSLPDDPHRSGPGGEAVVLAAVERDEAEDEAGEAEDEAEADDQDRRSATGGGLARVEELGGRRHRCGNPRLEGI